MSKVEIKSQCSAAQMFPIKVEEMSGGQKPNVQTGSVWSVQCFVLFFFKTGIT